MKNEHLHPTLPGWIHRDYDPCAHCKHPRAEHLGTPYGGGLQDGMCMHRAYANGTRCSCSQFQPLTTDRESAQNAAREIT